VGHIEFGYNIVIKNDEKEFRFFVKDTGIGIPTNRQEAVFQRFVQADITDKSAKQGAGLGLSIAKAYVEMMNGTISLRSEESKGSEFNFTIPCVETKSNKKYPIKPIKLQQGIKVLIAEDDLNSYLIYSSYLKDVSWELIHVNTGVEAIETMQKNQDINLILMDIKMPLMDGYTAAKRIRAFMPNIIIIAQSAYAFNPDKKEQESLFNQHITKPVDRKLLFEVLGQYFSKID
jgi:CheY-like chemotaxis protein